MQTGCIVSQSDFDPISTPTSGFCITYWPWPSEYPALPPKLYRCSVLIQSIPAPATLPSIDNNCDVSTTGFSVALWNRQRHESHVSVSCSGSGYTFTPRLEIMTSFKPVSYTHLRAHETRHDLV